MTDHAAMAREILDQAVVPPGKGYWSHAEACQHTVLRGIGHALLAIHEAITTRTDDAVAVGVAPAAEEKIHDLMQALEDSVNEAKAERDKVLAAREPIEDHGCA